MLDPTSFSPQSSDAQKTSTTRQNVDVYSGSYDTTGQILDTKSSGYEKTFTILALTSVGLANSVVDIDVWMEEITAGGGGTTNYNYMKLPFTRFLSNGTVEISAFSNVYYTGASPKNANTSFIGAVTLQVTYRNNVTATAYPKFYYKVSNRQVLR